MTGRERSRGRERREGWDPEREKESKPAAKNLLQNNKLSPEDFCRRVSRGWLLPEVTSLFLTDDAIIQVLGDVQENGLASLVLHFAELLRDMAPCLVLLFYPIKCLINYRADDELPSFLVGIFATALLCSSLRRGMRKAIVSESRSRAHFEARIDVKNTVRVIARRDISA
jgi:hypothetical protein